MANRKPKGGVSGRQYFNDRLRYREGSMLARDHNDIRAPQAAERFPKWSRGKET